MEEWPTPVLAALAGGIGGIVLGLAARLGRFCTLTAIEDTLFGSDTRRLRMWGLALAIAIAAVALLAIFGQVDFSKSRYHSLPLNPVAWIIGGLMFGFGMALCGTCGYGTLARVGGGDLRALFGFLVMGISAYMAIAGPTAHLRVLAIAPLALDDGLSSRTFTDWLGGDTYAGFLLSLVVAGVLFLLSVASSAFRQSPRHMFWGAMVGLAIVSGWITTAQLATDPFDPRPLESHTYSLPLGQTIVYFMTMSSSTLTFGIGGTLGVVLGAFIGALLRREFRWEGSDDPREMRRHLLGAFLMGTGGVYAGGCTIGQGVSAASLLAISAPVVMLSIWCGAWLGLSYLMEGSISNSLRGLLRR